MAGKKMLVPLKEEVEAALAWLEDNSTQHDRDNLVKFAINATKAFGVSMANMKVLAKLLGQSHFQQLHYCGLSGFGLHP
jgi:hypothetical protein